LLLNEVERRRSDVTLLHKTLKYLQKVGNAMLIRKKLL